MIKLIAFDIDGTIVPEAGDQIAEGYFDVIRALAAKGIYIVAASGRQYRSIRHLFGPVEEHMIYIVENGSLMMEGGELIYKTQIAPELAKAMLAKMRTYEGGEIALSKPDYLCMEQDCYIMDLMVNKYHNKVVQMDDLMEQCEETHKLAMFLETGSDAADAELQKLFGDRLNIKKAGKCWVDVMDKVADKGIALQKLQERFGITKEETLVIGDNLNDLGLIRQGSYSYAVATAHPQLKEEARFECASFTENGALQVFCELLEHPEHFTL